MKTQQPDRIEQRRKAVLPRRRAWCRLLIITFSVIIAGLITPLILFPVSRNVTQHHAKPPALARTDKDDMFPTAQPALSSKAYIQATKRIDNLLTQQVANQQFSGSVLIAQGKQMLLAKGYGMANWDAQIPNTPGTRFFMGSITKEFTAMSILLLQARGKLHVRDLLCAYIPHCPTPWQSISIHEVLTHTSGIPQLSDAQLSGSSPEDWIAGFDNVPLQAAPGDQFQYCNICYQVLAYVVQHVSGMPYTQFVQQMILQPLKMNASGFDSHFYYAQPGSAIGYANWQTNTEQLGIQLGPEWSFLDGSGLLYSTIEDMYRWDQALSTSKLVPQQTLEQIFTPYVTATLFPGSQYGYGWFISQSPSQGHRLIWHDGLVDGFRNYNGRYVDDNVTIIFLSNLSTVDFISLAHSIEQLLFGRTSSN